MPENIYSLEIFKGIEYDIIDKIIRHCEERVFLNGEMILIEGEDNNGEGYILKSGKVVISIGGSKIAELNNGDIFGEIALLNEEKRTATVTAISNLKVIVISLENIIDMINNDPNKINKKIIDRIEENISL